MSWKSWNSDKIDNYPEIETYFLIKLQHLQTSLKK